MSSEVASNKVLMIAPTPFFADRGCHVRILNAYLRLKKQGEDVTLLTYPIGRDIEGVRTLRVIQLPGYKKTGIGFSIYRPGLDLLLLIKAAILLRKDNYNYKGLELSVFLFKINLFLNIIPYPLCARN